MRAISILASLPVLFVMIFPQNALASRKEDTNTKINFETKDDININKGLVRIEKKAAPYNFEGYVPVENKTLEEIKNERILDRWRKKQLVKVANLPKGKFTINASAYTAAADECGKNDGITASGIKVKENRTLACPPQYPFGTKIEIDGYGIYTCEDRGGAIKGNKFDVYMETKAQAFAFGRRNLTAQVVQ